MSVVRASRSNRITNNTSQELNWPRSSPPEHLLAFGAGKLAYTRLDVLPVRRYPCIPANHDTIMCSDAQ